MLTIEPEHLGLRPGHRVLDVGCGDGRHTRPLRCRPGITTLAVDVDHDALQHAARSFEALESLDSKLGGAAPDAGPYACMRGSIHALPFPDASFDCVIASEVLEHLPDDAGALREISRVLRPAGLLAVSVPREGPEAICWALSKAYRNMPGGHVRIYRRRMLRRRLRAHGYRVLRQRFAHALHSPYWWLKCAVGVDDEEALPVRLYHRLLVWDLMQKPVLTRVLERALDPLLGKSVVFYARREA